MLGALGFACLQKIYVCHRILCLIGEGSNKSAFPVDAQMVHFLHDIVQAALTSLQASDSHSHSLDAPLHSPLPGKAPGYGELLRSTASRLASMDTPPAQSSAVWGHTLS